ncbi:MAG TPA: alpha/beta hydrolase, partial [Pseudonocardiaceae bacterium]|nr:alpha/beta hydrolase [Pseudonocardiaceae bacterium]
GPWVRARAGPTGDLAGTGRLRGMVSVDQTAKVLDGDGWECGLHGATDANWSTVSATGIPETGRGFTVEQATRGMMRLIEVSGGGGPPVPQPESAPAFRDHVQQDWRDVVQHLDVPVLMVAGRQSQYWPCEHAEAAVAGNPLGRAVVLEDCGHVANLDQVEEFNAALLGFLATSESRGAAVAGGPSDPAIRFPHSRPDRVTQDVLPPAGVLPG